MKSLKLLALMALISPAIIAQNSPIDFETGGNGASWTWTVFENDTNPPLEIITNPDQSGANTSSTVAKFTALVGGQPWAGFESQHGSDIGSFTMDSTTSIIKIKVWKSVTSDVGIKLVEANSASLGEIKIANTLTNQWEEITFDFSSMEGIEYDQIVIFPDFDLGGRTTDNVCYIDDVVFGTIAPLAVPMTAAPDPTTDSSLVISLFSDEYDDVTVDTWLTSWSVANGSEIQIDGNPTKLYESLNYAGIETVDSNSLDITEMDTFHLDMWTPNATQFRVKLVDFGPDNAFDGGDDTEHEITFESPDTAEWIQYDIPLDDFTSLTGREHISQLILSAMPAGDAKIYLDNVYFSMEAPVDTTDTSTSIAEINDFGLSFYPNPATDQITVSADVIIKKVRVYNLTGELLLEESPNQSRFELELSTMPAGSYLIKIDLENKASRTTRVMKN